jgi:formylglycine-generating enzyme required for sulfatase activity/transcriptional regulator of met regulon
MKLRFLLLIVLVAVIGRPALPQQPEKPLTKDQVMELVKAEMDNSQLAKLVRERGIDFEPTDDDVQALRKAGAQDVLIAALHAVKPQPLTRDQVLHLVAGGVPLERAVMLVRQRGIDFLGDEEFLSTLRLAGADDTLIAALREAGAAATAPLVVETSPNAEVFLDGESQGHANAQGALAMKAKLGAHALKVTLAGKKDFEQSVTVASVKATKVELRLADLLAAGAVRENSTDGLKYVWIPPGTFMMGCSPGDDLKCRGDEKPSHKVTLSNGFWMGQTEVTVGAYQRFAAATGRQMPLEPNSGGRPLNPGWRNQALPIVNVTWEDAHAYCGWAGERLPTEAEWEYAARAGSTGARYGDLDEIAWYADNSGRQRLDSSMINLTLYWKRLSENGNLMHEVGQKRANSFGLFDMLGNVWEWVNDWYDQNYYQNSPAQDPSGPASGTERVLRGGSWGSPPSFVRVSNRRWYNPGSRNDFYGFRCGGEVFKP